MCIMQSFLNDQPINLELLEYPRMGQDLRTLEQNAWLTYSNLAFPKKYLNVFKKDAVSNPGSFSIFLECLLQYAEWACSSDGWKGSNRRHPAELALNGTVTTEEAM